MRRVRGGKWLSEVLAADLPDDSDMRSAVEILKAWDRSGNRQSRGTALAMLAMELETPKDAPEAYPGALKRLYGAVRYLLEKHGRLDVPWEEMLRLRHGGLDLGLGGCPDCLRAVDIKLEADGRFVGINGDSFFQIVEWDQTVRCGRRVFINTEARPRTRTPSLLRSARCSRQNKCVPRFILKRISVPILPGIPLQRVQ